MSNSYQNPYDYTVLLMLWSLAFANGWLTGSFVGNLAAMTAVVILTILSYKILTCWPLCRRARMAGVGLRIRDYFKIPFSHTNPRMILAAHILAHQGGVHIPFADLETHFQAKGDVHRVARAMVAARQAGLDLDWRTACGFDLAGRDLLDAIERRDFGLFPLPKIAS